mgnify:CR=1 FL=1
MKRQQLVEQLKVEEGFMSEPYLCTAGHKTIGYGRNLDAHPDFEGETIPEKCSMELASRILEHDVIAAEHNLSARWPCFSELDDARQEALINMAFQLGTDGLLEFHKMLAAIQHGDWEKAYSEGLNSKWAKQCPSRAKRVMKQVLTGERYLI